MPLFVVKPPVTMLCPQGNHRPLSLVVEARMTPAWPPGARAVALVRAWVSGDFTMVKKEKAEGAAVKP